MKDSAVRVLLAVTLSLTAQDVVDKYQAALLATPSSSEARVALRTLADDPNTSIDQYERIRDILRQYPWPGKAKLTQDSEPGQKLIVSGTVRDSAGKPVAGAILHVFHTDASGHYARVKVMDEPHARLFAFIETGADGRFEFSTIRPGGYPGTPERQGEQWRIPSHVHFEIRASRFQPRSFQMVFDDDPRMTPYWHEWARKGRHPVVTVTRDANGIERAVCDVVIPDR